MSDTTAVTLDEKLCANCRAPFGEKDDKRRKECSACRRLKAATEPSSDTDAIRPKEVRVDLPIDKEVTFDFPPKEDDLPEGVKPLNIPISRGKIKAGPPKKFYWLGVTDDCPWHSVTAGGVCFQRHTGQVQDGGSEGRQEFRDNVFMGSPIQHLTKKHVDRILEEISLKVVRHFRVEERALRTGKSVSICAGSSISMKSAAQGGNARHGYVPHETDRPMGEFLWMIKVRNKNDRPFGRDELPPTLVTRP